MSETNMGKTPKIWLIAAICGVLAFLALLFIASYSTAAESDRRRSGGYSGGDPAVDRLV